MKTHPILSTVACMAAAAVTHLALGAETIEINFEMEEGYEPWVSPVGMITPAGRWYGKADFGEITPGEGFEGSQSLRITPTGDFASMNFKPDFEGIPARMRFTAMVMLEELEEGSFQVPLRLRVGLDGDAEAFRMHFYAGGKVEFFADGQVARVLDAAGDQFVMRQRVFTEVDVEMDFEDASYRLRLNGVPQEFAGSDRIPFQNTESRERVGRFELTNSHLTTGGAHIDRIRWTLDE